MKLNLPSLFLAAVAVVTAEAVPSPQSPSEVNEAAVIARQRLLLRPAWRPATRTIHNFSKAPLRRGRSNRQQTRAEEGKIAFRHNSGSRKIAKAAPGASAADLSAVPIHIDYSGAHDHVNMPFPLAVHANYHKSGHVKRDAGQTEADPDQEDDWDCEEEEGSEIQFQPSSQPVDQAYPISPSANPMASFVAPPAPQNSQSSESAAMPADSPAGSSAPAPDQGAPDSASPPAFTPSSSSSPSPDPATLYNGNGQAPDASFSAPPAPASSSEAAQQPASPGPAQDPPSLLPGSVRVEQGCTRFHTVVSGEICLGIINYPENVGLTLDQLYSWNPSINADCTNLSVGQTVCVSES